MGINHSTTTAGKRKCVLITCLLFFYSISMHCQLALPKLISDGMILQRDTPLTIWGWSSASDTISVQFKDKTYKAITSTQGKWSAVLPSEAAGGPYRMVISNNTSRIAISDILIGDVWLCSGQSNMEISMQRVSPLYEEEIKNASNPNIRYFKVPKAYNFKGPQNRIDAGKWTKTNPKTVLDFSAVAYFFAYEINREQNIPIGLINSSLGGSPVDAWLSEDALKKFPQLHRQYKTFQSDHHIDSIQQSDRARISGWYKRINKEDLGVLQNWKSPDVKVENWSSIEMPGYWAESYPELQKGVVWLRKGFELSAALKNKKAKLSLGTIVDADSVFVNGNYIGHTSYRYPPRRYEIPENILKSGKNTLAVKVINERGSGGFVPDKPYKIRIGNNEISLEGKWHIRQGATAKSLAGQTFVRWQPGGLYNAMIAPLLNYHIKGVLWYQGESDTGSPDTYQALFTTLINSWRKDWNQGSFPFLYVQLPNFMKAKEKPTESNWASLRDAQLQSLKVANTAMAVTIDIGEWNDIHPLNKKDVGHRLALAARHMAYGEKNLVYSGPQFSSAVVESNTVVLSFNHIGSGLKSDGALKGFTIAGVNKEFVWAKAKIKGDKVEVWSPNIENPKYVRYAWGDNPDKANLYNSEGLPASPFKTDP